MINTCTTIQNKNNFSKSLNLKVELTFSVLEREHSLKSKCDIIRRFSSPVKMSLTQYQQNKGNARKYVGLS